MRRIDDICRWLAKRNIGIWLGIKCNPTADKSYQHERLKRKAQMLGIDWLANGLREAEKQLAAGNPRAAQGLAHHALNMIPDTDDEVGQRARALAHSVVRRLPPNLPPIVPKHLISLLGVTKTMAVAIRAVEVGQVDEADQIIQELVGFEIENTADDRELFAALVHTVMCIDKVWGMRRAIQSG
jgi:hypothetical protein